MLKHIDKASFSTQPGDLNDIWGWVDSLGNEYAIVGSQKGTFIFDITDPVNGRDVVVEFLSAEETGASFPTTKIRVKPNQTPISDEPEVLEVVKSQQDIKEIYQELSYDDLTEILNEWLNPNDDSTEEETQETTSSSEISSAKKVSNTGDAFDELFNS